MVTGHKYTETCRLLPRTQSRKYVHSPRRYLQTPWNETDWQLINTHTKSIDDLLNVSRRRQNPALLLYPRRAVGACRFPCYFFAVSRLRRILYRQQQLVQALYSENLVNGVSLSIAIKLLGCKSVTQPLFLLFVWQPCFTFNDYAKVHIIRWLLIG